MCVCVCVCECREIGGCEMLTIFLNSLGLFPLNSLLGDSDLLMVELAEGAGDWR